MNKIFYHPDRLWLYAQNKLVQPITIELHITNACNNSCYYCYSKDRFDGYITPEGEIQMIMYKLKSMGVKGLVFSGGGEPTLHSRLTDILKFGYELDFNQGLVTNGILFDKEFLKYLEWVRFSFDTPDDRVYKTICGTDKQNTVLKHIEKAVEVRNELGINTAIGINMVITPENYHQILWMITVAESIGVDYFQFVFANNIDYPETITIAINLTKKEIMERQNKINIFMPKNIEKINVTSCPGADFFGTVDCYGNFYICRHHVGDESACYGNILKVDLLDELLQKRHMIQKKFDYSKCPTPCRGYEINKALNEYKYKQNIDFI